MVKRQQVLRGISFTLFVAHLRLHSSLGADCVTPQNVCDGEGPSKRPLPGCNTYAQCDNTLGTVIAFQSCLAGSIFDTLMEICNWENISFCNVRTCSPTRNPTLSPTTSSPTKNPTGWPTVSPTISPSYTPSTFPSYAPSISKASIIQDTLLTKRSLIENYVLVSYTSNGLSYPSRQYTFTDFYQALQLVILQGFGPDVNFLTNEGDAKSFQYGLVNVAAFLAQAMAESIQYDACDELNWEEVAGRYAISNSCGQEGRSYQHEICSLEQSYMSCPVDIEMEMTGISSGSGVRAPPPLTCGPGSGAGYYAGYWDTELGIEVADVPYSNANGRTDIEGCCWWGRGALSTRGTCNLGKFNWHAGKRAALDGRPSLYPNIDFCEYPEAVCSSDVTSELRWTIAFFEWAERVQSYTDNTRWSYVKELVKFTDGGMTDDSFIDSVSRVLSHGCHRDGCGGIEVRNAQQRKDNFYLIINDIFDLPSLLAPKPGPMPVTPQPTFRLDVDEYTISESVTPKPQPMPVLAPSLVNPQPGPYPVPPLSYDDQDETEMPTIGLLSLEVNGSVALFRSTLFLFPVLFLVVLNFCDGVS